MKQTIKLTPTTLAIIIGLGIWATPTHSYGQAPATTSQGAAPRSSLPDDALKKAREAEQLLTANQPDKAIAILQELDKQYPGQAALSLRLAEINDTNNQSGAALFYYRRYVNMAGNKAREIAVARVSTLELMAGVTTEAEQYARRLGETTRPVATPVVQVKNELLTEASDGSRVPLTSAEQIEEIQKRGYVTPAPKKPTVTPGSTPIILPQVQRQSPHPATSSAIPSDNNNTASPAGSQPRSSAPSPTVTNAPPPRKPDEDALLTQAFVKSDNPESVSEAIAGPPIGEITPSPTAPENTPLPMLTPKVQMEPPPKIKQTAALPAPALPYDTPAIAYTQATPVSDSPRAENFFNITQSISTQAQLVAINDLPEAVVTISLVPPGDGEVLSAILAPGETKTMRVKPGTYQVTANASSSDYSPVTLMNATFRYQFQGARQYTRRFNQTNLQQIN